MFLGIVLVSFGVAISHSSQPIDFVHEREPFYHAAQPSDAALARHMISPVKVNDLRGSSSPPAEISPLQEQPNAPGMTVARAFRGEGETFSRSENGNVGNLQPIEAQMDIDSGRLAERYDIEGQPSRILVHQVSGTASIQHGRFLRDDNSGGRECVCSRDNLAKPDHDRGQQRTSNGTGCARVVDEKMTANTKHVGEFGYHQIAEFLYGYFLGGLLILLIVAQSGSQRVALGLVVILMVIFR